MVIADFHEQIVRAAAEGRSIRDIGFELGFLYPSMARYTKKHGIVFKRGKRSNPAGRQAQKDAYAMKRHGCTWEQYIEVRDLGYFMLENGWSRGQTPFCAYAQHVDGADTRGIEWGFNSFWEWWCVWRDSGKWMERGRGRGKYAMCRHGDVGPYRSDNVYIALNGDNVRDGFVFRKQARIAASEVAK